MENKDVITDINKSKTLVDIDSTKSEKPILIDELIQFLSEAKNEGANHVICYVDNVYEYDDPYFKYAYMDAVKIEKESDENLEKRKLKAAEQKENYDKIIEKSQRAMYEQLKAKFDGTI